MRDLMRELRGTRKVLRHLKPTSASIWESLAKLAVARVIPQATGYGLDFDL